MHTSHIFSSHEAVLLDLDGLLVDTEHLHYASYMQICAQRGYPLDWDFETFCEVAHAKAWGFFEALRRECPEIFSAGVSEQVLYEEKKRCYLERLSAEPVVLMPGVEQLLELIAECGLKCAVVTNSPRVPVDLIRSKCSLLARIPLWVTREDYSTPKPSPEGYELALSKLGVAAERAIGFEDTLKGLKALVQAGVKDAVLVSPSGAADALQLGAHHYLDLTAFMLTRLMSCCASGSL